MAVLATGYVDSNFYSVLNYRGGLVSSLAQHIKTLEWWEKERQFFKLYTSRWTEQELAQGTYTAQRDAIAAARRTAYLPWTASVDICAKMYVSNGLIPAGKFGDAIQLAFATAHRMDYLITWNYAHLANPEVQHKLERLHKAKGWRSPWLVSPDTISWATLGQIVRRKDD